MPQQGTSTGYHNIFFCEETRKILCGYPYYLELCKIPRKSHSGLAKTGLYSAVVLFSNGPNSGILLFVCLNGNMGSYAYIELCS